jgi:GntR family transcriptional regulator/MocR family aminotransferase
MPRLGRNLRQPDEAGILSRAARAGLTIQGLGDFRYDSHLGYQPGRDAGPGHAPDPGHAPGPGLGSGSGSGQDTPAALVVGYGTPPDHAFSGALDTLCDVLG